ncbi:MAG: AAA family ATPase [Polyangiaceae bacterium]|nr:AAA family ATPase [Polyangiaceae bacterium]
MEEKDGSHVLRDLEIRLDGVAPHVFRISVDTIGHYELVAERKVLWSGKLQFDGVCPRMNGSLPVDKQVILQSVIDRLHHWSSTVHWLTAVRATVPRKRAIPHQASPKNSDGAWVQEHLGREELEGRRSLTGLVSSEIEELFGCSLRIDIDEREALFRATPVGTAWRLPLADLGEGVTQVLPVLTLCLMAERGDLGDRPILCIEQPEMHLHADAERRLATFLARVSNAPCNPILLVETHSEILLSTLLLQVAQGFPPENLAVHWVSRESAATESLVRQVKIDKKGNPADWPVGAFGQRSELSRALFLARRG